MNEFSFRRLESRVVLRGQRATYTLMNTLRILNRDPNPPQASQMPSRFPLQVLNHDARQHDYFRLDGVEDALVRQVEAVCDVL